MTLLSPVYAFMALLLGATSVLNARERRWDRALFWGLIALVFALGDTIQALARSGQRLPQQAVGVIAIVLALLAALRMRGAPPEGAPAAERQASAARLKHRLLWPALAISAVTGALVLLTRIPAVAQLHLGSDTQLSLLALQVGCIVGLAAAVRTTQSTFAQGLREHRRLLDTLGWAIVLPMLLAALGSVFAATHVGDAVAALTRMLVPTDSRLACVLAYGLGMVFFTVIMGNAFAAFPVLAGGIALPLLVTQHGAKPAVLGALGMLTGYCGTLLTPMAANFNLVPAALLELRSPYGVIRMQWPTALALLAVNLVLIWLLAFP